VNEFWFTPKLKGYGATPSTWEGYTLVTVFIAVIVCCVVVTIWQEKKLRLEKSRSIFPTPMIVIAVSTIMFLIVCAWKTDGAWG
jgi:energy-converting hydrogenase Eha subunit A